MNSLAFLLSENPFLIFPLSVTKYKRILYFFYKTAGIFPHLKLSGGIPERESKNLESPRKQHNWGFQGFYIISIIFKVHTVQCEHIHIYPLK